MITKRNIRILAQTITKEVKKDMKIPIDNGVITAKVFTTIVVGLVNLIVQICYIMIDIRNKNVNQSKIVNNNTYYSICTKVSKNGNK